MAKLRPSTKGRIVKLFKGGMEMPAIRKVLKTEGFIISITQMKTVIRKYLVKYCDNKWGEAVKLKAGLICIIDKKPCLLNAHHLIGRKNYKYRWDTDNGVCLGAYRHTMAHDMAAHGSTSATQSFADWMMQHRGEQWALFISRNRYDPEVIKTDVYFLLDTMNRLEAEITALKSRPKPDILARKKVTDAEK